MKVKSIFSIVAILAIWAVLAQGVAAEDVFALGYQSSVDLEFTFEPVLAISLSSADLLIPNLAPGTSAYSNTISVNVSTNNIAGYTLSAKVGDGTTYTNDKLVNATAGTYFNNLTSSATLSNFNDDDWGYALGTVNSSTSYSGLTYNVDTVINATTNKAGTAASSGCVSSCSGTNATDFTIAAKASSAQAAGDYNNVIIFTVVGNIPPRTINDLEYMQDFKTLSTAEKNTVLGSMTENYQYRLIDNRDNKSYYIAKLGDGNVWMTQNLDHDIGDIDGGTYTPDDTDIPSSWTPGANENTMTTLNWNYLLDYYEKSQSYDPGDLCWNGNFGDEGPFPANTGTCGDVHYHLGNYYGWSAAIATSDSSIFSDEDVDQSICPAGWTLPKSGNASGSFGYLIDQLDLTSGDYDGTIHELPVYFVYGGAIDGYDYLDGIGHFAQYWTSSAYNWENAGFLNFADNGSLDISYNRRVAGGSVRCVVR